MGTVPAGDNVESGDKLGDIDDIEEGVAVVGDDEDGGIAGLLIDGNLVGLANVG